MKSAVESKSEREERIKRRRDEAISEVSMSAGQAETLFKVSRRPSTWLGFAAATRKR
jgi:hypothetical protein